MKTVTFITDLHVGAHVAALEGVYERARTYGWHVVEIEYEHSNRPLSDYIRTWKPAGCIFSCSALTKPLSPEVFRKLPTVYIDPDAQTLASRKNCVVNDPAPLAKLAFAELSKLDCASYGFVGWNEPTTWSEGRRLAFEKLTAKTGKAAQSFTQPWTAKDRLGFHRRLAKWLKALPKPCGIFAANDDTASQVADVCHFLGLKSPEDVAIVGVDNLEIICENAMTTLTSVEIDFRQAGRASADLLALVMENPRRAPQTVKYGEGRIVRRQSTRLMKTCDARISRAIERIRREACAGLRASDVIAEIGSSRRTAETRFRAATGRSVLEEINAVRLERAFALLRRPNYPISLVAGECGWQTDAYLKRLFKRTTGLTMREWRRRESGS